MRIFVQTKLDKANQTTLLQHVGAEHTVTFRNGAAPAAPEQIDVLMGNPPTEQVRPVSI